MRDWRFRTRAELGILRIIVRIATRWSRRDTLQGQNRIRLLLRLKIQLQHLNPLLNRHALQIRRLFQWMFLRQHLLRKQPQSLRVRMKTLRQHLNLYRNQRLTKK